MKQMMINNKNNSKYNNNYDDHNSSENVPYNRCACTDIHTI